MAMIGNFLWSDAGGNGPTMSILHFAKGQGDLIICISVDEQEDHSLYILCTFHILWIVLSDDRPIVACSYHPGGQSSLSTLHSTYAIMELVHNVSDLFTIETCQQRRRESPFAQILNYDYILGDPLSQRLILHMLSICQTSDCHSNRCPPIILMWLCFYRHYRLLIVLGYIPNLLGLLDFYIDAFTNRDWGLT